MHYRVQLTRASTLSLGIRGGLDSRTIDFEKYIVRDPNDPSIPEAKQSETQPDLSLGLWYSHDAFYLGAAARSIVRPTDGTAGFNRGTRIYHYRWPSNACKQRADGCAQQHNSFFRTTTRRWISAPWPATMIVCGGGLSYRHQEAASILAGLAFLERKLRFTYAFDYVINNRKTTAATSHEISLQYRIGKRKETKGKYLLHKSNIKIGNIVRDRDHDEVPDDEDECIDVPGIKKLKGCPDKDNDGIADGEDQCPDIAGTRAFNGCPDTDNDGVMDNDDACRNKPASKH